MVKARAVSLRQRHLSAAVVRSYRREGFLLLRDVFSADEVDAYRRECGRLWQLPEIANLDEKRMRKTREMVSDERIRDRIDPVVDISPLFRAVASDPRIVEPVRDLLEAEPILFKDKVIQKPPGMKGYGLHQDYTYWWQVHPVPPDAIINAVVSIDAANAQNGAIEVFPRLHHRQLTPEGAVADVDPADVNGETAQVVETRPGDLFFFHSLTPHRSGRNVSESSRRQLFFTYSAADHGDLYATYYGPGAVAAEAGAEPADRAAGHAAKGA